MIVLTSVVPGRWEVWESRRDFHSEARGNVGNPGIATTFLTTDPVNVVTPEPTTAGFNGTATGRRRNSSLGPIVEPPAVKIISELLGYAASASPV